MRKNKRAFLLIMLTLLIQWYGFRDSIDFHALPDQQKPSSAPFTNKPSPPEPVTPLEQQNSLSVIPSDMQQLPEFSSLDELAVYLRQCTDANQETIQFTLQDELAQMDIQDTYDSLYRIMPSVETYYAQCRTRNQENTRILTVEPVYYAGKRMAYAWLTGNYAGLSDDEKQCIEYAVSLISEFRSYCKDELSMELAIHDYLCETVTYLSGKQKENEFVKDALGALLDGKANCIGYTDAFYLLGTIAGLEVGYVSGTSDGEAHAWNSIRLDGSNYVVDVTYDDNDMLIDEQDSVPIYAYFNVGQEALIDTRTWYELPVPYHTSLKTNEKWSYYNGGEDYGAMVYSAEEAIGYFLDSTRNGKYFAHAGVCGQRLTKEDISAAAKAVQKNRKAPRNWHYFYQYCGGNTYIAFQILEW